MKRLLAFLCVFCLLRTPCTYAEDAVSSATLKISGLPALEEETESNILVLWFSPNDTIKAAA